MNSNIDLVRTLLRATGPLPAQPLVWCLDDEATADGLRASGATVDTDAMPGRAYDMICGVNTGRQHLDRLAPGGVIAVTGAAPVVIRRDEDESLRQRMAVSGCERSAAYPPHWVLEYEMGPNPLWLAEALASVMDLRAGMHVLDLGCGNAITSVFLAREYGVRVCAADLWIDPGPNWARIQAAGMDDVIFPIKAEAHALPFAPGSFDAIMCVDSYEYFGSDDRYIAYLSSFVRPGGQIGVVQPITFAELDGVPEHLRTGWDWEFSAWHSSEWWHRHWSKTGKVLVERADEVPDSARTWRDWELTVAGRGDSPALDDLMTVDDGRTFGFGRIVARRI